MGVGFSPIKKLRSCNYNDDRLDDLNGFSLNQLYQNIAKLTSRNITIANYSQYINYCNNIDKRKDTILFVVGGKPKRRFSRRYIVYFTIHQLAYRRIYYSRARDAGKLLHASEFTCSPVGPIFQSARFIACSRPPQSSPSPPAYLSLTYNRGRNVFLTARRMRRWLFTA